MESFRNHQQLQVKTSQTRSSAGPREVRRPSGKTVVAIAISGECYLTQGKREAYGQTVLHEYKTLLKEVSLFVNRQKNSNSF